MSHYKVCSVSHKKMFLLAIVVLILNTVEYCSCERFNIVPSSDSSCPDEFTGDPCLTLEEYVADSNLNSNITFEGNHSQQSSNMTLNFHPGIHYLNSQLLISNIYSFTVQANTTDTVTILCREGIKFYDPLYFIQLYLIHISDITFIGCSMNLRSTANATFVRSTFINRSTSGEALHISDSSVWIEQCIISNNSNGGIYFSGSNSLLLVILQTIFKKLIIATLIIIVMEEQCKYMFSMTAIPFHTTSIMLDTIFS